MGWARASAGEVAAARMKMLRGEYRYDGTSNGVRIYEPLGISWGLGRGYPVHVYDTLTSGRCTLVDDRNLGFLGNIEDSVVRSGLRDDLLLALWL